MAFNSRIYENSIYLIMATKARNFAIESYLRAKKTRVTGLRDELGAVLSVCRQGIIFFLKFIY